MRSALVTAFEYLAGAKGPLRSALDWLRAHGLGERVIKSAVAAVLAWLIAGLLPDNPTPISKARLTSTALKVLLSHSPRPHF